MRNHLLTLLQTVGLWHVSSCCFRIFLHPHVFTVWLQFILMWLSLIFILVSICWTLWICVFHQFGKFSVIISSNLFLLFSRFIGSLWYVSCLMVFHSPSGSVHCSVSFFVLQAAYFQDSLSSRMLTFSPICQNVLLNSPSRFFFSISVIGLFQLENFCLLPIHNCSLFIAIFILFLYHFPDLH